MSTTFFHFLKTIFNFFCIKFVALSKMFWKIYLKSFFFRKRQKNLKRKESCRKNILSKYLLSKIFNGSFLKVFIFWWFFIINRKFFFCRFRCKKNRPSDMIWAGDSYSAWSLPIRSSLQMQNTNYNWTTYHSKKWKPKHGKFLNKKTHAALHCKERKAPLQGRFFTCVLALAGNKSNMEHDQKFTLLTTLRAFLIPQHNSQHSCTRLCIIHRYTHKPSHNQTPEPSDDHMMEQELGFSSLK